MCLTHSEPWHSAREYILTYKFFDFVSLCAIACLLRGDKVELGTPGSVELLSFAFPMLPKRADRAESARIIARLFCQRTAWANEETAAELKEFLEASVEKWYEMKKREGGRSEY